MTALSEFVRAHTERGECRCGKCADAGPAENRPRGHTVDLHFFKVALRGDESPERLAAELRALSESHNGEFGDVNPLDGIEHNYIEMGAWLGSQEGAFLYMGLAALTGIAEVLTPEAILGEDAPRDLVDQMAGMGFITMRAKP